MNIHFMPILSPHRVSERGKVVHLKFVSILGRNIGRLLPLKNKMYTFISKLQCDHDVLLFIEIEHVLRE
jgi:hypothetical protein